ncbi:unnamed protein product [Jaminaea pallidilutea]
MSQVSSGADIGSTGLGRYLRSWQWPLRKTSYPVIRCWFCNERSFVGEGESITPTDHRFPLSHGKPSNWICCRCGSRNLLDSKQPHGIGTWEPAMAQEASQHPSPASTPKRHTLLSSPLAAESSPLLCRRCRTNLQIQATVLSEEGGDDSDGGADFEELKTHLDDRYPVLCENCRPAVTAEITSRNKEAKREIWRQQMDQRVGSSTSSSVRKSAPSSSSRRAAQRLWTAVAWVQVATGVLACLAVVGAGADCCSHGPSPALFLLFAATVALQLYGGYDGSQIVLAKAPSRAITASIALYALFTGCISAVTKRAGMDGRPLLLLVAVAELSWLAKAAWTHCIQGQPRRARRPRRSQPTEDILASLSREMEAVERRQDALSSSRPQSTMQFESHAPSRYPQMAPLSAHAHAAEVPMDWQPSAQEDVVPAPSSEGIHFGRQRFYPPETATGLEDFLADRLGLADDGDGDTAMDCDPAGQTKIFRPGQIAAVITVSALVVAVAWRHDAALSQLLNRLRGKWSSLRMAEVDYPHAGTL